MCNTGLCPHCGGNACSCFCGLAGDKKWKGVPQENLPCHLSGYWDALKIAEESGLIPDEPDENAILDRLDGLRAYFASLTPEQRQKNKGFGVGHGLLDEQMYLAIQSKASQLGMDIPTIQEFGKEVGIDPLLNGNTGEGYTQENGRDIDIIDPCGWDSIESYKTERITWAEYCLRRHNSDCDFREFLKKFNFKLKRKMLSDIGVGEVAGLQSGKFFGKSCIVLSELIGDYISVRLIESNEICNVYAFNEAINLTEHNDQNTKQ